MLHRCKFCYPTKKSCYCLNKENFLVECNNVERNARLSERYDAASNHTTSENGRSFVKQKYCSFLDCVDFEESDDTNDCKDAIKTDVKWGTGECAVVKCLSEAKKNDPSFTNEEGRDLTLISVRVNNEGTLDVRSRFCNAVWCKYYKQK